MKQELVEVLPGFSLRQLPSSHFVVWAPSQSIIRPLGFLLIQHPSRTSVFFGLAARQNCLAQALAETTLMLPERKKRGRKDRRRWPAAGEADHLKSRKRFRGSNQAAGI